MRYSIIIPNYTYPIEKCLDSVLKYTTLDDTEIIVVANGCPQEKLAYLHSVKGINLIVHQEAIGFVRATNDGIRNANGEFIILMNDDVEILPSPVNQWVEILNRPFLDPKVAITGPHMNWSPSAQYPFLIFFLVMLRKSVLDEIGVLDEALSPGYNDDVDLCIRARRAGYKVLQVPDGTPLVQDNVNQIAIANFPVYHKAEGTFDHYAGWDSVLAKNQAIMAERYGPKVDQAEMVDGAMGSAELLFLAREARDAKTIIEVGSWHGRSTRALADNCPGTVYAVDHFNGSADEPDMIKAAAGDAAALTFTQNLADHLATGKVVLLRMESGQAAIELSAKGVKADMIFVDGEHSHGAVRRDINNYLGLLADGGLLCGHDFQVRDGVTKAVTEKFKDFVVPEGTTIWGLRKEQIAAPVDATKRHVLCFILTKGRAASTLPLAIIGVALQTRPPDHLIIYVDDRKDLREIPTFVHLFHLLEEKKISWEAIWGKGVGYAEGYAHNLAQERATDLVWRLDDDEYPEPNVLAELLSHMNDNVGAVAGLVLVPPASAPPANANNLIADIDLPNLQWFKWDGEPRRVEHLHSTFLYKAKITNFSGKTTAAGHREETTFTHTLYRMGYKLLIAPRATTWHFRNPEGGLRSLADQALWARDQETFDAQLREWGYEKKTQKVIFLDNGLGDHIVFSTLIPELKAKYGDLVIACCYPEVFEGMGVTLISLDAATKQYGPIFGGQNVYAWMASRPGGWKRPLIDAFRGVYQL